MDAVKAFEKIRDVPYRIPLNLKERDDSCSGKSDRLFKLLTKTGYKVRYRVCEFLWSSMDLPAVVRKAPHENRCTHTYLEVYINGKWRVLDATWDKGLGSVLHVNHWNGESSTEIAVKPIKTFTPEKSRSAVNAYGTEKEIKADLRENGRFYRAFNEWADMVRHSSRN